MTVPVLCSPAHLDSGNKKITLKISERRRWMLTVNSGMAIRQIVFDSTAVGIEILKSVYMYTE